MLRCTLRAVAAAVPLRPQALHFIEDEAPDVVAFTPLVQFSSPQVEYVRAARALGIPSVLCVHSWDNLTTKGVIHEATDVVAVGMTCSGGRRSICMTSTRRRCTSPVRPRTTGGLNGHRAEVASSSGADVGLDPETLIILYVCSSSFIAPREDRFVERWLGSLRARPEALLRTANVIVRPHPQAGEHWARNGIVGERVVVWPRGGADPIQAVASADYFDSIHHAGAVVGVNTSALIESVIVGRPVYAAPAHQFAQPRRGRCTFTTCSRRAAGRSCPCETWTSTSTCWWRGCPSAIGSNSARGRSSRRSSDLAERGVRRPSRSSMPSSGRPRRRPAQRAVDRPWPMWCGGCSARWRHTWGTSGPG